MPGPLMAWLYVSLCVYIHIHGKHIINYPLSSRSAHWFVDFSPLAFAMLPNELLVPKESNLLCLPSSHDASGKQLTGQHKWASSRKDSSHFEVLQASREKPVSLPSSISSRKLERGDRLPAATSQNSGLLLTVSTTENKMEDPLWPSKQEGKHLRHPSLAT